MQNNTVLRVKAVAARLDISTGTVWNKCNPKSRHYDADFPRPFKISANATGWLESEINAYIEKLSASRL
ncbi:helix-turn-helix transcriptional regulator [Conchiformibius steedae]|uniref:AlpA family phage regulatory protein n=1 Tax=Conchiformibius steedae TaxID=153493 RepID=A0A3P2A2W8_9NEIS|nr:AlpA family phage regulatory protein [Conchiformibius steedae]RRD88600.1 AlpA family phage regulatory protein [Conchiformibius steedae]